MNGLDVKAITFYRKCLIFYNSYIYISTQVHTYIHVDQSVPLSIKVQKIVHTHRTISSQNGSTRKRDRVDQLSVWLVFVFPFPSIFIKYSFFSLINGSERKRSFKLNTAFNSYDIFKSWKLFYKLFHKKSQKSLWNLDKKQYFTEILVLRYDFQKLISYKFILNWIQNMI